MYSCLWHSYVHVEVSVVGIWKLLSAIVWQVNSSYKSACINFGFDNFFRKQNKKMLTVNIMSDNAHFKHPILQLWVTLELIGQFYTVIKSNLEKCFRER